VGAGNNQKNAAAVVTETAVVSVAIVAARLQRQAGVAVQWNDNNEGSGNSYKSGAEFMIYTTFPLGHGKVVRDDRERRLVC
jgi:hypothetical protein